MKQFFILKNNQQVGPMTVDQLVQQGLAPNSMVWTEGMASWLPASQVPELAYYFAQPAAPAPQEAPAPAAAPAPAQQQPMQAPYQQPYQQPYQPQAMPDTVPQPANNTLQKVFKIILYVILGLTSVFGLSVFIISFLILFRMSSVLPGLSLMFFAISIIAITIIAVIRMIKNEKFGFLTLGFFAVLFLFLPFGLYTWYFKSLFICGLMGLPCALFASVPLNDFGGGLKNLLKEATVIDYVLLGIFSLFTLLSVIFLKLVYLFY